MKISLINPYLFAWFMDGESPLILGSTGFETSILLAAKIGCQRIIHESSVRSFLELVLHPVFIVLFVNT